MTVYSWNMLFNNKRLDEALAFIRDANPDVFCLQEVPEEFAAQLKSLPYSYVAAPEVDRIFDGERSTQYVVILSKFPIRAEGRIPLPYREPHLKRRSRWFVSFMMRMKLWGLGLGDRHAIFADVVTPHGPVRIFNVHLPLATPAWRAEEFEQVVALRDAALPTIVCGDFNILESPRITPLSWILGGTVGDAFFWKRERAAIEHRFAKHELANPLRGLLTHSISKSQLDHILVSKEFEVKNAEVVRDSHGSDHFPVRAELDHI